MVAAGSNLQAQIRPSNPLGGNRGLQQAGNCDQGTGIHAGSGAVLFYQHHVAEFCRLNSRFRNTSRLAESGTDPGLERLFKVQIRATKTV